MRGMNLMLRKFKAWFEGEPPDALRFSPRQLTIGDTTYEIRRLQEADVDAALTIEEAIYHATPWDRLAFLSELRKVQRTLYLALLYDGDLVAFIGCWFTKAEAHITNLAVAPAWQRRGIGRTLMTTMIAKADAAGCACVTLEVRTDNAAGQGLYHALGFVDGRIKRGYYVSTHADAMDMRLDLPVTE